MISFGEDKYKPALKTMWKLCFPMDTDIFIDFYFNEVYKNDETLVYLENGKPAAAFQMIPYTLKNGGEISLAGYISGAMTHPDFRQKGFMRELMLASFDIMQERGFDYTFLVPQETGLFDFYGKFGYELLNANYADHANLRRNKPCADSRNSHNLHSNDLWAIYSHFLSQIPQAVLKTEKQFQQILHDFFNENGVLFANELGIAFTFKKENRIVIKEFFYQSPKIKEVFLKVIRDYYFQEEMVILSSSDKPAGSRGMIKRLNDKKRKIPALYISMMLD